MYRYLTPISSTWGYKACGYDGKKCLNVNAMWKSDVYHLLQISHVGRHVVVRELSWHQSVRGLICWNSLYNSCNPPKTEQ